MPGYGRETYHTKVVEEYRERKEHVWSSRFSSFRKHEAASKYRFSESLYAV